MKKAEIKFEINKVLEHLPDNILEEVLLYLKQIDTSSGKSSSESHLDKILKEDKELLHRLAQ